jgi:hypothetical protein
MDKYTRVLPAPAPGRNSTADPVTGDTSLPRNALDITPNGYLTRTADVLPDPVDAENAHQINSHVDLPLLGLMAQDPAKRDIFPDFLRLVGKTAKAKLMPAFRVMRSAQSARGPAPTPFPNWELNAGAHPSVDGGGPLNELFYRFLKIDAVETGFPPKWLVKPFGNRDGAMTVVLDCPNMKSRMLRFGTMADLSSEVLNVMRKLSLERQTSVAREKGVMLMTVCPRREPVEASRTYYDPRKGILKGGNGLH